MRTKALIILMVGLFFCPFGSKAQNDSSAFQNYLDFKEQILQEYNDFVTSAFSEFEQFLAEAWTEYQSFAGEAGVYSVQKPETVPSISAQSGIIEVNAPFIESNRATPMMEDEPEPTNDLIDSNSNNPDLITINFYGRRMEFNVPQSLRVTAEGTKERHVARYHETMRNTNATQMLEKQLDAAVNQMGLNDWGYFVLLRSISEKLFTKTNDRVLFSFYMLHSHGFKARVGRGQKSGQLLLMLALDNSKEVYTETFFRINGTKFYVMYGNGQKGECAYSYNEKADDSGMKEIGLDFPKPLCIAACDKQRKLHLGKLNQDIEIPYSTSHLRYYDEIPTTVFPIYFKTPVAKEAEQALTQTFNTLAKQYNKVQLVDIMLNFVQTAFAYKIDEQQFGREKYFFPEEVIGYPFSDCEDRSALFAWLVRRFVGYDVIGVLYDDHLATAVCFGDEVQLPGKSVNFNGKRYFVCDPTYSNAAIGTVMPKFVNAKYEIVKIN